LTRSVLVTGATGSLGSVVLERFAGSPLAVDLRDRNAVRDAAGDARVAIHCAAVVSSDLELSRAVNVEGTRNLVDALAANRCERLVFVSTISVYDDSRGQTTFDEDAAPWTEPISAYGYTKAEAERIVQRSGVPFVIVRPGMILSLHPRSRWGALAIERARRGPLGIEACANVPYVHVDNLVDAIALALGANALGRTYNVVEGSGETSAYLAAIGSSATPDPLRQSFPAERIRSELGWSPKDRWREFLEGLR
jgi:nucleoside-diphosphate-sugar epimerase